MPAPPAVGQPLPPPPAAPAIGEKYDPAEDREKTRARLAVGLAFLLGLMGLSLIGLTASGEIKIDEAKELAEAILSPIVVLTGTALGFYFGVQQENK